MRTSEHINELVTALVKAHGHYKPVVRNATGQVGQNRNYKYADLAGVIDATFPALLANGIVCAQAVDAETQTLVTRLAHISGQWLESAYPLGKYDRPQDFGSQLSYARRYSLLALLGVAQEDDDGQTAQQTEPSHGTSHAPARQAQSSSVNGQSSAPRPAGRVITEPQRKRMYAIGKKAGWSDDNMRAYLASRGFEHSKDVTADRYDEICKHLELGEQDIVPASDDDWVNTTADPDTEPF